MFDTLHSPFSIDWAWRFTLSRVLAGGRSIAPRGKQILELDHHTLCVSMEYPVLICPERKISYKFMAAEALWILSGSNKLEDIAKYNQRMAEFSDDGCVLAGAYGPRIVSQIAYVVGKLAEDTDTRQATLVIWQAAPAPSKDIPCTVAMDFKIREGKLNCHVFMRSSDIWLGVPYDVFSFSMVSLYVLWLYNRYQIASRARGPIVSPGTLFLTAASSHLYQQDVKAALEIRPFGESPIINYQLIPVELYDGTSRTALTERLLAIRDGDKNARWWNDAS